MSSVLLSLESVDVKFGGVKALDGVNLTLTDELGIIGLIGPNGAGKTTLLSVVTGSVKFARGIVTVLDRTLHRTESPSELCRRGVARTFQIPRPFAKLSVLENLNVAAYARPKKSRTTDDVQFILNLLDLTSLSNSAAGSLSLAERKRLELARALMTNPRILLVDEVFEGLSEPEMDLIIAALFQWRSASNGHIVLVEHVLSAMKKMATTLVVLDKGRVIKVGQVDEVLADSQVQESYLGISLKT